MIGKARGKQGVIPVFVYDSAAGAKRYVRPGDYGMAPPTTERAARKLEALAVARMQGPRPKRLVTVEQWRETWLTEHHGPGTPRPEPTTATHNRQATSHFASLHGTQRLEGFPRSEALSFAQTHPQQAKAVAAMFATALHLELIVVNPFSKLGLPRSEGRAHIDPLTAEEIDTLADIARRVLGVYGDEFAAFLTFLAWTGVRPGEACALEWPDIDLARGLADIRFSRRNDGTRGPIKKVREGRPRRRTIVIPQAAVQGLACLPRSREHVFATPTGKPLLPNNYRYYWGKVRSTFLGTLPSSHWLPRRIGESDAHLDVYELRHFCGSYLASEGLSSWDIAEQLGNTPAVCERIYVHPYRTASRDRVRRALDGPPALREIKEATG